MEEHKSRRCKAQVQDLHSNYFQRDPDSNPVNENWTWFRNTIKEIVSNTVPHKVLKGNIHKPWFTPKLNRLCSKKEKAYIKAKKSGKEEDWKTFTEIRKQVNNSTRTAHRHYINELTNTGNTKTFWRYVRSRRKDDVGVQPLKVNNQLPIKIKHKHCQINLRVFSLRKTKMSQTRR